MSALSASHLTFPRIDSNFIRGVTTSIQFEAAKSVNKNISSIVRAEAEKEHFISREYRPSIVHYYDGGRSCNCWDWGYRRPWDWGSRNTTYITNNYYDSKKEKTANNSCNSKKESISKKNKTEKESDSNAAFAALIGSVLVIAASALVGYAYSEFSNQRELLNKTQEITQGVKDALINNQTEDVSSAVCKDFARLIDIQLSIDKKKAQKVSNYFYSAVGFFAGSASLASGGFFMIPSLITAGKVALLGSSVGGVLNFGLHCNDESRFSKHYEQILGSPEKQLKGLADQILERLELEKIQAEERIQKAKKNQEIYVIRKEVPSVLSTMISLVRHVVSWVWHVVLGHPLDFPPPVITLARPNYQPLVPECYVVEGVVLESAVDSLQVPVEATNKGKTA